IFLLKPGFLQTRKLFRKQFTITSNSKLPKNPEKLRELLGKVVIRHRRSETSIPFTQRNVHLIPVDFGKQELLTYTYLNQFISSSYGSVSHFEKGINRLTLILLERMVTSSPHALISTLERILVNPSLPPGFAEQLATLKKMALKIKTVAKVKKAIDIVTGVKDKIILFTQFRETQEHLKRVMDERGIDNILFYGGLTPRQKDEIIHKFSKDVRVLISTDSGAEGRNLQFCRNLINFDLPWNPMKVEQRIGRVHRLGQQRDVDIFNIFYRDSIEEYVVELLMHKIRLFKLVVGELDIILGLTKQSIDLEEKIMDIVVASKSKREMKYNFEKLGRHFSRALRDYDRVKKAQDALY
ncbi:MAG: ATP-dependent helicase, partial [Candidatus Wallbacteria bacterium]|nr:ATP-dependent helicase [Candidatus Wallbacteria bacterium]